MQLSKTASIIISIVAIVGCVAFIWHYIKRIKYKKAHPNPTTTNASIKPMSQKEIEKAPNILQLYKEKVVQRDKYIQKKQIPEANVINQDYIKITNYILRHFDDYKVDMREMLSDDDYRVQASAAIFCLRCGIAEKKSINLIKRFASSKGFGVVHQDSKKIYNLIDKKKLPYYDGFPRDEDSLDKAE